MRLLWVTAAAALSACGGDETTHEPPPPSFDYPLDDTLRFHHVQVLATHNSYHVAKPDNDLDAWAFTHQPLDVQLDELGIRQFELDVRYDYAAETFTVFHLPVIDPVSNCATLDECLALIADWSSQHPGHHPLVVQLEVKDTTGPDPEAYFSLLHDTIRGALSDAQLVTPADVAAPGELGATIAERGWPTLGELRGKVMFSLDNVTDLHDAYTHGGAHVDDRILFPSSSPGDPFASIAVLNDPIFDADAIEAAVAANMLVRTRADSDVVEPLANDTTRRDAAFASGAHFVSTDFPAPVDGMEYHVSLDGGTPSRCNPVTAPSECTSLDIENPDELTAE